MYSYAAYGLEIESAFELPELPPLTDGGAPDLVIEEAPLEPVPESVSGRGDRRVQPESDRVRFTYDGIGTFCVTAGRGIRFDPDRQDATAGGTPPKVVRRLIQNELLATALHQRGALVLHASAVAIDGAAVVFVGPRGAGKSTTAAAFSLQGNQVLEDDVVAIETSTGRPRVLPGTPQLRLEPEVVDTLDVDATSGPEPEAKTDKRYASLEGRTDPVPLAGIYALRTGDRVSLDPIEPQQQVLELVGRTYTRGMLSATNAVERNFQQCTHVLKSAPFTRLTRPKRFDALEEVLDTVTTDLADSRPTTQSSH